MSVPVAASQTVPRSLSTEIPAATANNNGDEVIPEIVHPHPKSPTQILLNGLKHQNKILQELVKNKPPSIIPSNAVPSMNNTVEQQNTVHLLDQIAGMKHDMEELTEENLAATVTIVQYQKQQEEYETTIQHLRNENNQLQRLLLQSLSSSSSTDSAASLLSSSSSSPLVMKSLWTLLPDSFIDKSTLIHELNSSTDTNSLASSGNNQRIVLLQDTKLLLLQYIIPFLYFVLQHTFSAFLVWGYITMFHYLLTQSTIVSSVLTYTTEELDNKEHESSIPVSLLPTTITSSFSTVYGMSFTGAFKILGRFFLSWLITRIKTIQSSHYSSSTVGTTHPSSSSSSSSSTANIPYSIMMIPVMLSIGSIYWLVRYFYINNFLYSRIYRLNYQKQQKIKITVQDLVQWIIDGKPNNNLPKISEHFLYLFTKFYIYIPVMLRIILAFYTSCYSVCSFSSDWCVVNSSVKIRYDRTVWGIIQYFIATVLPTALHNNNLVAVTLILAFTVLGISTADIWHPLIYRRMSSPSHIPLHQSTMMAYGLLSVKDAYDDKYGRRSSNGIDTTYNIFSFFSISNTLEQLRLLGMPIASTLSSIIILQFLLRMDTVFRKNDNVHTLDTEANEIMILQQNTEDTVSYYLLAYWIYSLYCWYRSANRNASHSQQVHQYLLRLQLQKQNPALQRTTSTRSTVITSILDNEDMKNLSSTITAIEHEYIGYKYEIQQIWNICIGTVCILLWNFMYVWGIFSSSASSSSSGTNSTSSLPPLGNTTTSSLPFSLQTLLLPLFDNDEDRDNVLNVFPSLYQLFFTCLLSITDIPQVWLMSIFISFSIIHRMPRTLRKR